MRDAGYETLSIGKLHYRSPEVDTGFSRTLLPMHVVDGRGDVLGSVRNPLPKRAKGRSLAKGVGTGETSTTRYDRAIADAACGEILGRAKQGEAARPWLMFVSFVAPHFPLTAPEEFAALYPYETMPLPFSATASERGHPWFAQMRQSLNWDDGFDGTKRRQAVAAYYALTSFMDANVGRVLDSLDQSGLASNTRVIYLSDHGEALGKRDLWGKSTLYEESAAVPLIIAGPDVPAQEISARVGLADIDRTVREAFGLPRAGPEGTDLLAMAQGRAEPPEDVLSQFHGGGAASGAYMIRYGDWKYIAYAGGYPSQLFHLPTDPQERSDRSNDPAAAKACAEGERRLRRYLDPEQIDKMAKADQANLVDRHGGREAVISKGGFGATPPPGDSARYGKGK
ncbi:sulfatase-like hydrolase/transferase [Pseudohoeflea sp. DP4N28-3]|uniref:Sulfatase-like hydrolase/transferase n=1 Tax=Pseudohoeflea coraliihabitans TaxID=2860393 RepID=A0ABS6WMK8_9HYPH|nr:sulfatase-like hydrolase/transferase [Pseudohoeflea sp. DP4N28-3]